MKYKWDSHINSSITKANTTLEFFRRNIKISYTTFKEQAYKSLVRPSLEYACPVWDTYTNENITQLEQVQRRADRYVTNRHHNTSSVSNMIGHLNWQTLADRRTDARLVMLYKISHELVPNPKNRHTHTTSYITPEHALSPTKYHAHAYNPDSNRSFREQ